MMTTNSKAMRNRPAGRAFFDVHRTRPALHNRGMLGGPSSSSSMVNRAVIGGVGAAGAGGFGAIIAMFCGALTLMHLARATANRQAELRWRRLQSLRRAIVGARKHQLVSVLGPPRATIGRGDYRADDTWYYAIDPRRHVALAVEFADGIARQTQVITGM